MSSRVKYHVTKTDTGWKGKAQGAQRASTTGTTKAEVMKNTIAIAKNKSESSVIIHKKNGKFQEERTYPRSSDPSTSKG